MDPVSVAASITGLLTASIEIAKLLAALMNTYDYARTLHDEIHHFRFILFQLDRYVCSNYINVARASMIDLDQVVTLVLGCMITFSELERELKRLNSRSERLRGMWWIAAKPRLVDLVQRLENHKQTIHSMLSILTSGSQDSALAAMHELNGQVAELVRINAEMTKKLGSVAAVSGLSSRASIAGSTTSALSSSSAKANFSSTLLTSRVYRRARLGKERTQPGETNSAENPETSWSVLSGISLSEVSNYAAYTLPITTEKLFNPTWYTTPQPVVPLEPDMPEVPALLTICFADDLKVALTQSDTETAKAIANYIPWETVLRMSAVYPTLAPNLLDSFGEVLDSLSLFKLWLQCGGDSEAKNQHGQTAIKKALENENWRLFKLLARNGADINLTWDSKTVLHRVMGEGGEAFVLGLCEDMEEEDKAEIPPTSPDLERKRGQAVEVLLKLGADINAADGWGKTALHWFSEGGHKGVVEVLLSNGADIHAKDMWGTTSLHWASEGGHRVVAEFLLSHGVDVNVKDRWGMTAIYYASEGGHRDVVEVLLGHGADIGSKDRWEKTTLHCASWCGDKRLVEVLLSHGADIHAKDMWGTTSLHWASEGGHKGVVKILLRRGGDINAKDRWGMTALHHASKGGHKGVVKILLRRGADINAKDRSEDTALHLALESGHNGVIELLSSRGADISGKGE